VYEYLVAPSAPVSLGREGRSGVKGHVGANTGWKELSRASVLGWSGCRGLSEQLWLWGCSARLLTSLQNAGVESWTGRAGACAYPCYNGHRAVTEMSRCLL